MRQKCFKNQDAEKCRQLPFIGKIAFILIFLHYFFFNAILPLNANYQKLKNVRSEYIYFE